MYSLVANNVRFHEKTFTGLLVTAFFVFLMLINAQSVNAQNTLTTLMLTANSTAATAYSLRNSSSVYVGSAI